MVPYGGGSNRSMKYHLKYKMNYMGQKIKPLNYVRSCVFNKKEKEKKRDTTLTRCEK
jgi:hypothetical protein